MQEIRWPLKFLKVFHIIVVSETASFFSCKIMKNPKMHFGTFSATKFKYEKERRPRNSWLSNLIYSFLYPSLLSPIVFYILYMHFYYHYYCILDIKWWLYNNKNKIKRDLTIFFLVLKPIGFKSANFYIWFSYVRVQGFVSECCYHKDNIYKVLKTRQ